jgi:hypothetical protein
MTTFLAGIFLYLFIRIPFSKPYRHGLERFEDKNNWNFFNGC